MSYVKGNICRIYLENFLTYNKIQINPSTHLNVVIGPNGTGKSSILCGICIGLGGKPELTGRGKSLVEYIKNGENQAKTEIELFNPDGANYIIRREFSKTSSGSSQNKWYLQNCVTTEEKIKAKVKSLGIQVNNLCQFLPQDRVIEFAKMDKVELLSSTEKAVGEIELSEQHKLLQDFGKNLQDVNIQLKDIEGRLENEIRLNNQLEDQVKNIQAKKRLDKCISELEQILLFHQYNESRDHHCELKRNLAKLEYERKKIEQKMLPNKKRIDEISKHLSERQAILKERNFKLRNLFSKNKNFARDVADEKEKIDNAKDNYRNSQQNATRIKTEIDNLKTSREVLKAQLEQEQQQLSEKDIMVQIRDLTNAMQKKSQESMEVCKIMEIEKKKLSSINQEFENSNYQLNQIKDLKNRKLQILKSRKMDAFWVAEFLENENKLRLENPDRPPLFRGRVLEPLYVYIDTMNGYSKYVENVVSNQDLIAFVCEDKKDLQTLKLLADRNKKSINIVYSSPDDLGNYQSRYSIDYIQSLGFDHFLKDTIRDAPPSILSYLCRQYKIHQIPVTRNARLQSDVPPDINLYFVGNQRFFSRRSRYDHKISTDVSECTSPIYLSYSSDSENKDRLLEILTNIEERMSESQQQLDILNSQYHTIERGLQGIREEKASKQQMINKRKEIQMKIDVQDRQISEREKSVVDLNVERQNMSRKVQGYVTKMVKICGEKSSIQDNMKHLCEAIMETTFSVYELQLKNDQIAKTMENDEIEASSKLGEIKKAQEEKEQVFQRGKQLLNQLLQLIGVTTYNDIPQNVREYLEESKTKSIDELKSLKTAKQIQRDCLIVTDDDVLRRYEKRKKEIEDLKRQQSTLMVDKESKFSNIKNVRELWLRNIRQLTSKINENFSRHMTKLGCAGEVQLDVGADEDDFSKYGLSIRVKFRDTEKLKELTAQQQSGGERSVTTALYLLALQQTPTHPVPFRCVDEINQGMDTTNERKMFTMLVDSMTKSSASQYFIVSPKLLPNLPYNKYVYFVNLFNWESTVNIQSLSTSKILERYRKCQEERRKKRRNCI